MLSCISSSFDQWNSRCRLLLKGPVPAVLSYITIFNCPKSVPTIPLDSPELQ